MKITLRREDNFSRIILLRKQRRAASEERFKVKRIPFFFFFFLVLVLRQMCVLLGRTGCTGLSSRAEEILRNGKLSSVHETGASVPGSPLLLGQAGKDFLWAFQTS